MTHPTGPSGTRPTGGASTGPGRPISDRTLIRIFSSVVIGLSAVTAAIVALTT